MILLPLPPPDANGYYQVFVPEGGPYLLQAIKDGVKLLQITPQVEVGIEYDLGTADCSTTAVALIVQAMLDAEDYPNNLADINLTDIAADPDFNDVMNPVCSTIEAGGDPTELVVVQAGSRRFPLSTCTSSITSSNTNRHRSNTRSNRTGNRCHSGNRDNCNSSIHRNRHLESCR